MFFRFFRRSILLAIPLLLAAGSASAHHMTGGRTPSTFAEGLLSGLGHPVIGIDHLAFLIAVGIVVGIGGLDLALPVLFVAASALGVAAHVYGITVPAAELIVALTVLSAGLLIARGRALSAWTWGGLFALAGLFHGYAYGESIFGAETSPLGAYLLGLVVVQSALAVGIALSVRRSKVGVAALAPRLLGAAIAGAGIAVLMGQIVPGA